MAASLTPGGGPATPLTLGCPPHLLRLQFLPRHLQVHVRRDQDAEHSYDGVTNQAEHHAELSVHVPENLREKVHILRMIVRAIRVLHIYFVGWHPVHGCLLLLICHFFIIFKNITFSFKILLEIFF